MGSFSTIHWSLVFHLFDDDDAPRAPFLVGYILAQHSCQFIQGLDEVVSHHGGQREGLHHCSSPYRWDTGLFDPLGDPWGCFCAPTATWEHHRSFAYRSRGHPFITTVGALPLIWHMLDFTRPSNDPPSYCIIISALLRGLFFILWSYLVVLSKGCYLYIIFY